MALQLLQSHQQHFQLPLGQAECAGCVCWGTAASPVQAGTGGAVTRAGHSPWAGHSQLSQLEWLLSVTSVVEVAMLLWL